LKMEARLAGSDELCPICFSGLLKDAAVLIPCRHKFCTGCVTTFLRSNADSHTMPCPICRVPASLRDVETLTGENLRQSLIKSRSDDPETFYYEVDVKVQTVNFGDVRPARHPVQGAASPSRRTPDLWEICDSCYFEIEATADRLQSGSYDVFLHVKRLPTFKCQEPVRVHIKTKAKTKSSLVALDKNLKINWTMLKIATVDLEPNETEFSLTIQADQRDWWKSGLIVDCLMVKPSKSSSSEKEQRGNNPRATNNLLKRKASLLGKKQNNKGEQHSNKACLLS